MTLKRILSRGLIVAGVFFIYQLISAIVLVPSMLGPQSALFNCLLFGVSFGALIWVAGLVYQRWLQQDQSQHFGIRRLDRGRLRLLLWAVLTLIALQVLSTLMVQWHWTPEAENQTDLIEMMQAAPLPMVLITVVGAPPVEELTFRALLMHSFPHQDQARWRWLSGGVATLLFGLAHTGFTDPLNLLIYCGMGAVFTAVYAVSGDVRYSIGLHFLNNFAALFL